MENISEIFIENNNKFSSESILSKIKKKEWSDILLGLCSSKHNYIIIDYTCFKYFATTETYNIIIQLICNHIDTILKTQPTFIVYVNLKMLTLSELDKHKLFIKNVSIVLKDKYPNRLDKCYVYNAPIIFSQLFTIISFFIDKNTQSKIELVTK
jgi:hypothetical protein